MYTSLKNTPQKNTSVLRNELYNSINYNIKTNEDHKKQSKVKENEDKKVHKGKKKSSAEIKFSKKGFTKDFITFVLATSSIHGLSHLSKRKLHPAEYFLWITGIIMGTIGIYWLSSSTWNHYQTNPTVISIENNYQEWRTMFPAITICPMNKISADPNYFYEHVIEKKFVQVDNEEQLYKFMKRLTNWNYAEPEYISEYPDVKPSDYIWIYVQGKHKFKHMMSFNEIPELKNEDLKMYITEYGICYAYLSRVTSYTDPEYWKANKWNYVDEGEGFESNPLDGDNYFQFTFSDSKGFLVFLHSPEEMPDIASPVFKVTQQMMKTLGLTALSIYSTKETYDLSVTQRKCRLLWESNLEIGPIYTFNWCRMDCRRKLAHRLCGCVPYFYRQVGNYEVCDTAGLACLALHQELLTKLRNANDEKVECQCLPSCNDINYTLEDKRTINWSR
ncbi:bile acid-sensitive ion channel-like isoform X2 [Lycorma delicatula]|uniref:bile acid-sensitive ion channel-like isoform X2 n=1 Tax=Lycorma delicatula TaxID=130591 RepID=UPI003F51581E